MNSQASPRLADLHCHLGFSPNPAEVARALTSQGIALFSTTVLPTEFAPAAEAMAEFPQVKVGLGYHPWWVEAPAAGSDSAVLPADELLSVFERQLPRTAYVGEIGLDFSARHQATREAQLYVFRRIVQACVRRVAEGDRLVVSVHAVGAAAEVLDVLERAVQGESLAQAAQDGRAAHTAQNARASQDGRAAQDTRGVQDTDTAHAVQDRIAWVLHWFSGSGDDLTRARQFGCWFSVGERMLATRRGRSYAQQIPLDRLVLETDLPAQNLPAGTSSKAIAADMTASLTRARDSLAAIKGVSAAELTRVLARNSAYLLDA